MEALLLEALLRSVRMVALVTGALVAVDSAGILLSPHERPAHKPKWSALAWMILGVTFFASPAYLLADGAVWVGDDGPTDAKLAVIGIYFGATVGFTVRAMSRAHRPALTALAMFGMVAFGVAFALRDLLL